MPTFSTAKLPRSDSAEEFENMCADVLRIKYNCHFKRYGRRGQKQNGIDLIGSPEQQSCIVVQCKNYSEHTYKKLKKQLEKDIEAAGNLPFDIKKFVVMTALDADVEIQNYIINIKADFKIDILFWDDIQAEIYESPKLLKKYYPSMATSNSEYKNKLISITRRLKQQVEFLCDNCLEYKAAYQCNEDVAVYNQCVCIFNLVLELGQLHDQWYFQLKEGGITTLIEKLEENIPAFHDENADGTGGSMISTITDFISYFFDIDKKNKFISCCDQIIEQTEKL